MNFNKLSQFRTNSNLNNRDNINQENVLQVFDFFQEEEIQQNQQNQVIQKCEKPDKLYQQQSKQQIVKSEFCKIYKDFMFDEPDLKESQFFYNSEYFKNNMESQNSQIQFSQIYQENSISLKQRSKNSRFLLFQVKFLYFTFKIRVYNTTKDEDFDQWLNKNCEVIGRGGEGEVLKYQNFAIKRFNIDQNFQNKIQRVISQYSFLKILSCYKCAPKMLNLFGFDIICTNQSICFSFQVGISISNIEQINVKKINNIEKDLKQNLRILHSLRIIHYDIKPSNIIYSTSYNKFVFIDFGMSQMTTVMFGFMQMQCYKGTFFYSSPQMKKIFFSKKHLFLDSYYNDMYCLKKTTDSIKHNQILLLSQNNSQQINKSNFFIYQQEPLLNQRQKMNLDFFQILNLIFQRKIKGVNQFYIKNQNFFLKNVEKIFLCFIDLKICYNIIQIFQKYFLPNLGEKKQEFQSIFMQRVNQMEEIEINYIPEKQSSIKYQFFLSQQKSANSILQISKQSSQKSNRLDQICKQASRIQLFYCYLKDFLKICKKNIFKIKKEEEKKQINQGILIFNNLLFEQQSLKISLNSQLNQTIVKSLNNLQNDQLLCSDTFNFENLEFQFTVFKCLKLLLKIWFQLQNQYKVLNLQKKVINKHRNIIKFIFTDKNYEDLQNQAHKYLTNIMVFSLNLSSFKISQMYQTTFLLKQFCDIIKDFKFKNELLTDKVHFFSEFIVFKQHSIRFFYNDHRKIIQKACSLIELLEILNKKYKIYVLGTKKINQMYFLKLLMCLQRYYFLNQQYYELFKIHQIFLQKFNESFQNPQNSLNLYLINLRIQRAQEKLKANKKLNNNIIFLQKIQSNIQNYQLIGQKAQQKVQKKSVIVQQNKIPQIQMLFLRFKFSNEQTNIQRLSSFFLQAIQKYKKSSSFQQYFIKMYNILRQNTNFQSQQSIRMYLKLISNLILLYNEFKINQKLDEILDIMINQIFQMILSKNCFKKQYPVYLFSLSLKFIQQSKDPKNINKKYWKQLVQKYQIQNLQKFVSIQFCQCSIFHQKVYVMYYLDKYNQKTEKEKIQNQFQKLQELKKLIFRKKSFFSFLNDPWFIQCGKVLILQYINKLNFKLLFQLFYSFCQFLNDFPSDYFSIVFKLKYVKLFRKFLVKQQIITAIKHQLKVFLSKINLNNCKLFIYVLFVIYINFSKQQNQIEETFSIMKKIGVYLNDIAIQLKREILQKYYTVLIKITEQRHKFILKQNTTQTALNIQFFSLKYIKQNQHLSNKAQFYLRKKLRSYQVKNQITFIQQWYKNINKWKKNKQMKSFTNKSKLNIFSSKITQKLQKLIKLKQ